MQKFQKRGPLAVEAKQFTDMDSYLEIVAWMKECGDTHALANEIHYSTPIMYFQTWRGAVAANPGDWIVRGDDGKFFACPSQQFAATYAAVEGTA